MNRSRRSPSSLHASIRVWLVSLALTLGSLTVLSAPPGWWAQRGVLTGQPADDYAVANLGQLKHLATKAREELNARLPGRAGPAIDALIDPWFLPDTTGTRDDFAALNLGQLKRVAEPFYDRLIAIGFATGYPWAGTPDDFAPANLGQLKHVFSFDFTLANAGNDSDLDGLADWWELMHFNGLSSSPSVDSDGDGLTNLQEFIAGTDPFDFYNGVTPILTVVSGDNQSGLRSSYLPQPLVVQVTDANLNPIPNVPLTCTASSGALLGLTTINGSALTVLLNVRTQFDGKATLFCYAAPVPGNFAVSIAGTAPGATLAAVFHETITSAQVPPPAAPTGVEERQIDRYTYEWTWLDTSDNESEFIIERQNAAGEWIELGRVGPNSTTFRYTMPQ